MRATHARLYPRSQPLGGGVPSGNDALTTTMRSLGARRRINALRRTTARCGTPPTSAISATDDPECLPPTVAAKGVRQTARRESTQRSCKPRTHGEDAEEERKAEREQTNKKTKSRERKRACEKCMSRSPAMPGRRCCGHRREVSLSRHWHPEIFRPSLLKRNDREALTASGLAWRNNAGDDGREKLNQTKNTPPRNSPPG